MAMAEPPLLAGAVNVMVACVLPAVAVPMVGAPGTMALMANVWDTVVAAFHTLSPVWAATIVQLPAETRVNAPLPVMVQMPGVVELKLTGRPEVADAVRERDVPKFWAPGLAKEMVCSPFGVTGADGDDAPLEPMALVAMTVKV